MARTTCLILVMLLAVAGSGSTALGAPPASTAANASAAAAVVAAQQLRERVLAALPAGGEIVFAQRVSGTDHWYVNFGTYACPTIEYPARQRGDPAVPRGGGWRFRPECCRSAFRTWGIPDNRDASYGFRVVVVSGVN